MHLGRFFDAELEEFDFPIALGETLGLSLPWFNWLSYLTSIMRNLGYVTSRTLSSQNTSSWRQGELQFLVLILVDTFSLITLRIFLLFYPIKFLQVEILFLKHSGLYTNSTFWRLNV